MTPTDTEIEVWVRRVRTELAAAGYFVTLDGSVRPHVAALIVGVQPSTLKAWRSRGGGPRYRTRGGVWYPLTDLAAWALASRR